MNSIEIINVDFEYREDTPVLENINLTIKPGEWVTILGHNGSGKSTLSKLLVGLLKAKKGSIKVHGIELSKETVYDIRKKIGIVFQNPDNQFVGVTVRDDIAFGLENLQVPRDEMIERIEYYANKVSMAEFLNKEPHALSGGQKQRVAIAGILAMQTDIIIFDEATSMLDPKGRAMVMETMKSLKSEGKTIITITHTMKEALFSDRIVVLKQGRILKEGPSETILRDHFTLSKSNLELLLPLKILHELDASNFSNERIRNALWELSLNV